MDASLTPGSCCCVSSESQQCGREGGRRAGAMCPLYRGRADAGDAKAPTARRGRRGRRGAWRVDAGPSPWLLWV